MKTGAKITIGIIGIIAAGIIGVLISMHQLDANKADKGQIAATTKQGGARTAQGGANASGKALNAPTGQPSDKQVVADKDEEEGWNALMEVIDEMAETPDTRATIEESETPQTSSSETDGGTDQDQPEMEYHESYNTFISITRDITQIKSEMRSR